MVADMVINSLFKNDELILLDKPTVYLDKSNADKIANIIKKSPITFCIASHDREFLDKVCNKPWIIEQSELKEYKGNYTEWKIQRNIDKNQYDNKLLQYQKETKKLKKSIQEIKQ